MRGGEDVKKFDVEKTLAYIRALNRRSLRLRLADLLPRPPTIQLLHRIDIYDKNGKLVKTTGDMKSHSFVLQFLQMMEIHMAHAFGSNPDSIQVKDTGGILRTWSYTSAQYLPYLFTTEAEANNVEYGILVGTGTTTPAQDDYALETKILHGSTSGKLQYGATVVNEAAIVGSNVDMVVTRTFINASGATITIREVGLAVYERWSGSTAYYFLWAHDSVNQSVDNTYVAVVTYTLRTTV